MERKKSVEKILAENSIIFNESEDGNIVISGLYSGFKPYKFTPIDIVDLYSQHLEKGYDNTFKQSKLLSKMGQIVQQYPVQYNQLKKQEEHQQ